MRWVGYLGLLVALTLTSAALGQGRVWVLPVVRIDNQGIFTEETTGGYVGAYPKSGHYWWATTNDGVSRAYWKFQAGNDALGGGPNFVPGTGLSTEDPPAEPRLYFIRTWIPPAHSDTYSIIEADIFGPDNPDNGGVDPRIPWNGKYGTNHQYIQRNPSNQGTWKETGPGPHTPLATQNGASIYSSPCSASETGATVWLRKGDWLYVKWNFNNDVKTLGVSAIEITEANTIPPGGFLPLPICNGPVCRGPLDLRCLGNADPLYGLGASNWWDSVVNEPFVEPRSDSKTYGVDDWSLAAQDYRRPCNTTTTVSSGLPTTGAYTAQLTTGSVQFQLRYEGRNSIKWDTGQTDPASPVYRDRVFTLNETSASEFVVRPYNKLYLLTAKSGGNNGQLDAELVYSDSSSQTGSVPLFDWFNTNGDATSIAVGANGVRRDAGGVGFQRIKGNDDQSLSINDGNTSGAFLFVHPINIDPNKNLSQIKLSLSADARDPGCTSGLCGNVVVVGAALVSSTCVFDVAGGLPDGSVDMNDFGVFQACYTGATGWLDAGCLCMDVTGDSHVDYDDLEYFLNCATGPAMGPPPANCDVAP